MTDETKKLFDAPWAVDEKQSETFGEVFDVMDEEFYLHYARCYDEKTANRLARLPELYDALDKAAPYCPMWLTQEIVTLLQKVRDGE